MRDGVEHGFVICSKGKALSRGPESSGHRYGVKIDVACGSGKPIAVYHTHPGGRPEPSQQDIQSAQKVGIPWVCIGVPETGALKCHHVPQL